MYKISPKKILIADYDEAFRTVLKIAPEKDCHLVCVATLSLEELDHSVLHVLMKVFHVEPPQDFLSLRLKPENVAS